MYLLLRIKLNKFNKSGIKDKIQKKGGDKIICFNVKVVKWFN